MLKSPIPAGQDNKGQPRASKSIGPVSDLERHLPNEWWRTLFNSLYLKTDGDVVENHNNTVADIDLLIKTAELKPEDVLLDVCCGQGRHTLELARRGFKFVHGLDRSRYLIRLARKRAREENLKIQFSEGDARNIRQPESSHDAVFLMGNSFGYFEKEEDDHVVLRSVLRTLRSQGTLVLDVVDGEWMKKNFEPRSWEWIDQHHFVNRERSLSSDNKRIISREVVTHTEMGVIADQFYAERLYTIDELKGVLAEIGFVDIVDHGHVRSESTRGQDLGMMAHRIFITAKAPVKQPKAANGARKVKDVTVIMGDPRLPDVVKKGGKFNEEDFKTIQALRDTLKELKDYHFTYMDNHKTLLKELMANPPEFVLNLCDEGYFNNATLELHIPAILEMLKVPYTGAGPGCLALCYDKAKVRAIAAAMDVDVPLETYYSPTDQAANIPSIFPALLKPACGDSSIGITMNAVVKNARELVSYIDYLKETIPGSAILIQEYLTGEEYSVGVVGNRDRIDVLPILQVDYSNLPEHLPKILSYESKWEPDSPYWTDIKYKEAVLDEDMRNRLINVSRLMFDRLDCKDYARFDFRCDVNGVPKLLEVNPNPGWCWDGKFNLMAGFAGISYGKLLESIIREGIERQTPVGK